MANDFFNKFNGNNNEVNNNEVKEVEKRNIDEELKEIRAEKEEIEEREGKNKKKNLRYLILSQKENELNKEKYLVNYNKRADSLENKINKIIAKAVKENRLDEIKEFL